jgi:ComF family protein
MFLKILPDLFSGIIDFIFPNLCLQCGMELDGENQYFCVNCWGKLRMLSRLECDLILKKKFPQSRYIDHLVSLFYFIPESISQKIIHLIKYERFNNFGVNMGKMLAEICDLNHLKGDYIIPVPLHRVRERERGYNQSTVISSGIGEILNLPVRDDILTRKKYTHSQTTLSKEERIQNVHQALTISPGFEKYINNQCILVFDDVITTGSTINSCAKVLKENGANDISVVSLAIVESFV